jgi:branched-subunit amino acid transport protein
MSRVELWVIILGGMAVTYALRLSFIALLPIERLPAAIRRGLRYVPPAILSAIAIPEFLAPTGKLDISLSNEFLIAGILAGLIAWRTRNTWLTIIVGLIAIVIFSSLG